MNEGRKEGYEGNEGEQGDGVSAQDSGEDKGGGREMGRR